MTTFSLGINTCFAVKRWPEPRRWAEIVRSELGLQMVQHSLDLVDFNGDSDWLAEQAAAVRAACSEFGLTLHSTFTGLRAYSENLLMHPDAAYRRRAEDWYRSVIGFSAAAGATSTGGHVGAISVDDWANPSRSEELRRELVESLARLARDARRAGLSSLLVENLAVAREPSTMAWMSELLTQGDDDHVPIRLCLDVGHQVVVGEGGEELDPYAWLRRLGSRSEVIHLQQSDETADHHWPFTDRLNAVGRIRAEDVLRALDESGTEHANLVLEVIPAFEADDAELLADLRTSLTYWKNALAG